MSIGNLQTDGNKGNNYPYQFRVLQGLQNIFDQLIAINADTTGIEAILTSIAADVTNLATEATLQVIETNTTGVARTPGFIREVNAAGDLNNVVSTFYSVSVANVGSADGTVLGAVIRPGEILNFSADSLNNFFTSFPYAATGTEFIITYVS